MEDLRALVLNSAYEPLQFTASRRALVLILKGKAEAVESDGFFLRSVSVTYRLPTVIRLLRYVKRPQRLTAAFSRKNVLRRDDHTCQYCGVKGKDLTMDHVVPRSLGGASSWDNVVAACRRCNLKKGSRTPAEAGFTLMKKPRRPMFLVHANMPEETPKTHLEAWLRYIPRLEAMD